MKCILCVTIPQSGKRMVRYKGVCAMTQLETERLLLRGWRESDAQDLYAYASSPVVGPMAGWKPHKSLEESLQIIRMFQKNGETWALCSKESNRVIGSVGLHTDRKRDVPPNTVRMLGYVLAQDAWGKGLMVEACREVLRFAFDGLGLQMVSVYHYSWNRQSQRVIEKLDFRREGTFRMASIRFDGRVLDDVCYSMTRDEYYNGI
jgi:ribosomal-protein-alanine N-acetyltransferase